MRTLVVEDDFVSRRLLQVILSAYGECDMAEDGKEAVEAFEQSLKEDRHYDLICLDIMMPGMDGQEVLRQLRKMENDKGICGLDGVKIIMTTAVDDPKVIMNSFKEQCEGYINKPIDRTKLTKMIEELGLIK